MIRKTHKQKPKGIRHPKWHFTHCLLILITQICTCSFTEHKMQDIQQNVQAALHNTKQKQIASVKKHHKNSTCDSWAIFWVFWCFTRALCTEPHSVMIFIISEDLEYSVRAIWNTYETEKLFKTWRQYKQKRFQSYSNFAKYYYN